MPCFGSKRVDVVAPAALDKDGKPESPGRKGTGRLEGEGSKDPRDGLHSAPTGLDVGASPGGWTSFLAASGCGAVIAVDPGKVEIPAALPGAERVEHMAMKVEAALPLLAARGVRPDLYCCDMNADPSFVVDLVVQALPLLAPAAQLLLTFKNVFKHAHEWDAAVEAQLARLRTFAEEVTSVHLMANTTREVTVYARRCAAGAAG